MSSNPLLNYVNPVKYAKNRRPRAWGFDSLSHIEMPNSATIGAGVANTTVQQRRILAQYCKIAKVVIAFDAIDTLDGDNSVNLVLGTGSYGGSGAFATGSYTVGGTPLDAHNNTYVIGGTSVVCPQATANSTAQQAAADAILINANVTVAAKVLAEAVGSTVYLTAKAAGTAGNGITTTASVTGGGDTLTANQASTAGGAAAGAITLPPRDNFVSTGTPGPVAAAGQALFSPDIAFNTTNFPGATTAAGTGGVGIVFRPPNNPALEVANPVWDAVLPPGTIITSRVTTSAGAGSITNLLIALLVSPLDYKVNDQNGVPLTDW